MECINGKIACEGIAIGRAKVVIDEFVQDNEIKCNPEVEKVRLSLAVETAKEQIQNIYEKALKEVGKQEAQIFTVHLLMLEDDDYLGYICGLIEDRMCNAEFAVHMASNYFAEIFLNMDDDYMRAREADIRDISSRIISVLSNKEETRIEIDGPSIIVAKDLSPSQTLQMDKQNILAFVTARGSINSHTAILARTMNIPAVVETDIDVLNIRDGREIIVNAYNGIVTIDPTDDQKANAERIIKEQYTNNLSLQKYKYKEATTKSGKSIQVYANIGQVEDVKMVIENNADGIGLFRSEFLFLGKDMLPSEEEQYKSYMEVASRMGQKKVIIRTLDLGADKRVDYLGLTKEENPAMGYRAIRICLHQPEIFKVQLRAIQRAAVHGNISVMYPMIISVDEIRKIRKIMDDVDLQLAEEGIPHALPEQGIMIETPASVLISDELAKYVDFFSIGTNDLTQYTLAIDRQNSAVDDFFDPYHPSIIKMLKMTVDNGHKAGIWVGLCGELGADTSLTEFFINIGIDELSVSPAKVLEVKRTVCQME